MPSPSSADWLRVVLPHLSDQLADPDARVRLLSLGAHLPGACAGVLEVRLGPGGRQVDLALCLRSPEAARQVASLIPAPPVRVFLARWSAGAFPRVPSLWVEWDLDRPPAAKGALPPPALIAKVRGPADPGWVTGELLPALQGEPLAAWQQGLALRCLAALAPEAGRLLYAFCLHSRTGRPLRLELFGMAPAALVSYLARLSPDHARRLAGLAPLFAGIDDTERLHLSLDLEPEGLRARFGVEGSFARLPAREPRWRELFDRLVAAGLCTPERRDAVLAWPGWDSFRTAPEVWPVGKVGLGGFCARALSHVKVVSEPGRPAEAKAYLAFNSVRTRPGRPARTPRTGTAARSPAG